MLIKDLSDLEVFAQTIQEGSLSAAGRELGLSSAVVTKRLQRLEAQLGVRLINRSTRTLSLTEEGAEFYENCVRLLAEFKEVENRVTSGNREPQGTLRVTVSSAFGRLHIAPLVPEFLQRYPKIRLSLHLSDGIVDLISERYDLAIRIGELKDSNLIARPLSIDRRVVVATPAYLKSHGEPKTPAELSEHNALLFACPTMTAQWRFINPQGKSETVTVSGNFESNTCEAVREAVRAGIGIALRPTWDVWRDIQRGIVKVLLPDYTPESFPIQAVYPSRQFLPQKVRLFIEILSEHFGETPYWDNLSAANDNRAES